MAGTAPRTDIWIVVEQSQGWGTAPLARSEHGVRVVMAQPLRARRQPPRAWIAWSASPTPVLRRARLADPHEVADWDLAEVVGGAFDDWGEPVAEPLLLVCTNGRRDRCCGHIGGRVARRLADTDDADFILRSTHLGGHRFAPTALLLPWGALHGRLSADDALQLLAAARVGRGIATTLRGYSTLPPPAQVAEAHARLITRYLGLPACDVRLTLDASGERANAEVLVPGVGHLPVTLRREIADVLASCGKHLEPTPRWVVDS
jgi:hypothetical protein